MPRPSRKMEVLALLPEAEAVRRATTGKTGSVEWLMGQTGLSKGGINDYLAALKAEGLAHVARRNRTERKPAAVWARGPGEDAPMPPALGTAVYSRRYRRNVAKAINQGRIGRKFDDRYASHVALALAEEVAARTRANPQHWFSALGI